MISLVRLSNKTWTMQICTHQFWYCYFRWFHVYQLMRPKIVTAIISVYRNATTNWTNQIYCESSMIIINNQKDGNSLIHYWELRKQPRITENNHTKSITCGKCMPRKKGFGMAPSTGPVTSPHTALRGWAVWVCCWGPWERSEGHQEFIGRVIAGSTLPQVYWSNNTTWIHWV